jgi:hypothetical protein
MELKNMKTLILFMVLILSPMIAFASPFVISDPYPLDGAQPDGFKGTLNGVAFDIPADMTTDGLRYFRLDLAGKWQTGKNTLVVRAYNVWGESADANFTFTAGSPAKCSNLRIIK